MWQRAALRKKTLRMKGGLGDVGEVGLQIVLKRIPANVDRELDPPEFRKNAGVPERSALGARRGVARAPLTGVAKAHGHEGDQVGVVELLRAQTEPGAQTLAAGVVPGCTGLVRGDPRSLPDDQEP